MDLSGRTVFITGAARGIGAETARRLASRGANVALAGLEPDELARVSAQCGTNAAWFECDVIDWDALEAAVGGAV
ncbi:MAG: SDR family NAD(P)-dependent oxidoreductase, partial [Thermoleophilaceae bacterium]